jgi:hypothetical protein
VTAETLACLFHETYERLAPSFGYETREDSAVPWDQVPDTNRKLMVAVAEGVLAVVARDLAGDETLRSTPSWWVMRAAGGLDCAVQLAGPPYSTELDQIEGRLDQIARELREAGR